MNEHARYGVGIDVGTATVRCVVGHIDPTSGTPTVVGVGQAPNNGMRKGVVANLAGPAKAIDDALGEAERMSGYEINAATLSINGTHIMSVSADGMIAVGAADHEIQPDDVARVEEVATIGKIPANREVLEVVPHSFRLDGQDNIRDPLGMTGTRLEIKANVISALTPHLDNLRKAADMATVNTNETIPAVLASARAVLTEKQLESGVAVVDMGAATTSVAVFEEGDLQYIGVVPMGGANITNDLAIGLKADPDVAETVKLQHASAVQRKDNEGVSLKQGDEILTYSTEEIDEIVGARLDEVFEAVEQELKKAGRAGQLPSGIVLVGGAARMQHMTEFVREKLSLATRIGIPRGFGGVSEKAEQPDFAAAVGLMLSDSLTHDRAGQKSAQSSKKSASHQATNALTVVINAAKNVFTKLKP
jgi:cell division protein FtsA